MTRSKAYMSLETDPWYGKLYKRMTKADHLLVLGFLMNSVALNNDQFVIAIRNLFIDKERPKNWQDIDEALMVIAAKERAEPCTSQ